VVPTVAAMRANADAIRTAEMQRAIKRLGGLSEKELATVDALTCSIVNKMLHDPTSRLKDVSSTKDGYSYVAAARYLYALDGEAPKERGGLLRSLLGRSEKASAKKNEMGDSVGI
jgi:glutamyl-tRNA reductase